VKDNFFSVVFVNCHLISSERLAGLIQQNVIVLVYFMLNLVKQVGPIQCSDNAVAMALGHCVKTRQSDIRVKHHTLSTLLAERALSYKR
jgi:hypothetical protein